MTFILNNNEHFFTDGDWNLKTFLNIMKQHILILKVNY